MNSFETKHSDMIVYSLSRKAAYIMRTIIKNWPEDSNFTGYIAGGSIAGDINDVDLFPADDAGIPSPLVDELSKTRNATTFDCTAWTVQVCNYRKASLEELVESFDYAHIQAGATFKVTAGRFVEITAVYYSPAYIVAKTCESSWFTGSEYPLSSVIRAAKYYKRGAVRKPSFIRMVLDALTATVTRGFKDYEDFKDQLDAVDLGLLTEEMDEVSRAKLVELYNKLQRR